MKKHQIVAIVVGGILSLVSFLPVLITSYDLSKYPPHLGAAVFLNPTIGVAVAAVIVFIAFLKSKDE